MSFKVIDNKLLKKYTKIWERVSSLMNLKSSSEPIYGDNDQNKDKNKDIRGSCKY